MICGDVTWPSGFHDTGITAMVYGGIGALVVKDELQEQAEERGLFVLTQGEHESAKLHAPKRPRVL